MEMDVWENLDKEGEYIVIEFTHFLLFHANTFLRTFVHSSLEFLAGIPTFLGISCKWNFLETKDATNKEIRHAWSRNN